MPRGATSSGTSPTWTGPGSPREDPAKARPWTVNTAIDALTSPRTQGLKMTGRGKQAMIVLDGDGEPIRLGPPTFDPDTWKQIQEAAPLRKMSQRTPSGSVNPMLGIGMCGCKDA